MTSVFQVDFRLLTGPCRCSFNTSFHLEAEPGIKQFPYMKFLPSTPLDNTVNLKGGEETIQRKKKVFGDKVVIQNAVIVVNKKIACCGLLLQGTQKPFFWKSWFSAVIP